MSRTIKENSQTPAANELNCKPGRAGNRKTRLFRRELFWQRFRALVLVNPQTGALGFGKRPFVPGVMIRFLRQISYTAVLDPAHVTERRFRDDRSRASRRNPDRGLRLPLRAYAARSPLIAMFPDGGQRATLSVWASLAGDDPLDTSYSSPARPFINSRPFS